MTQEQRSYWRHVTNGDKGYLVSRQGRDFIRLNRPGDPVERVFRAQDWIPELEQRPLSPMQIAKIAYVADQELAVALGVHDRKPWLSLSETQRKRWMDDGPPADGSVRRQLWEQSIALLTGAMADGH